MSIYIFLYIIIIAYSLYIWFNFFNKNKNIKWVSFLLFIIFSSLWFVLYFLTYLVSDKNILLYVSRFTYWISFLGIYVLGIFLLYFDKYNFKVKEIKKIKFVSVFAILFAIIVFFTSFTVKSIYYNFELNWYYEKFWCWYHIYLFLELIMIFVFSFIVYKKYKKLQYINKIRYKYILIWLFIFVFLGLFFQWILPVFWIYLFEKEVILYILPFLLAVWYSSTKYSFIDFSFRYKKILSFFLAVFTVVFLFYLRQQLYSYISRWFVEYWWINYNFTVFDIIIWIILFTGFYNLYLNILPWNIEYENLINYLNDLREKIPFIMDLDLLNNFLQKEAKNNFNIKYFEIKKIDSIKNQEIYNFFNKSTDNDIFINDFVFLEENKHKLNLKKIKKEINKKIAIIFPIRNNKNELVWILELGFKPFKELYFLEEINIIKKFVKFLAGHLKYIDIYNEVNNLNLCLDKKIDEKTIEYNNLINKQKEFISIISHEIKTPVMISSFQIENILDELENKKFNKNNIKKEVSLLKEQITKIANLTKTIFSVEQYDLKKIKLYLEKVDIVNLLNTEIKLIKSIYSNVKIDLNSFSKSYFIEIDKVLFTQVISNLLNNSIKFIENKNPIISITLKEEKKFLIIIIEDNWIWFKNWEEKFIFDKYNTWKNKYVWLWMWLYLCNKIVKLHKWEIIAWNSKKLWGAKFIIKIPKN